MFKLLKAFCLTILFFVPLFSHASPITPASVLQATNASRKTPLTLNKTLSTVAEIRANDMAYRGYFSHTTPEGLTFKNYLVLYPYKIAGENLAINLTDTETLQTTWMNSPKHKENIVNPLYTEMGIGIATDANGRVFVVEIFGKPLK